MALCFLSSGSRDVVKNVVRTKVAHEAQKQNKNKTKQTKKSKR